MTGNGFKRRERSWMGQGRKGKVTAGKERRGKERKMEKRKG